MRTLSVIAVLAFVSSASSLKILGYNPISGHSHANFLGKIADVLSEAGHEVVLVSPVLNQEISNRTSKHARAILIPPSDELVEYMKEMQVRSTKDLWNADNSDVFSMINIFKEGAEKMGGLCERTLKMPGLIESLKAEKFDVAYTEVLDLCGFAIFNLLGIEKYAVTMSIASLDGSRHLTGAPSFPSYVPGMFSSFGDHMTITERFGNIIATHVWNYFIEIFGGPVQESFSRLYPDAPLLMEMVANSTFFFVNSEPLIDFQRPVTRKIIDIGGISVPDKHKPLDEHFSAIMNKRPKTVLISFGSVMFAHLMPAEFKETIRQTAAAFPNVTFIWKYEKPEHNVAEGVENLITSKWVPQTDLLRDGRLTAFITHGGMGSVTETTLSGVPAVAIPVMGDQMRNGQMIKRLGNGILQHKDDLGSPEKVIAALREVLETDKYTKRARHVAAMVAEQPQSVKERLVSHFEFMAKYGPLPELNHVGSSMGIIEYYNLDIFGLLALAVFVMLVVVVKVALFFWRCVRVVKKEKNE